MGFANKNYYRKFDKASDKISKTPKNMGIIETVIEYRSEEAVAEAVAEATAKATAKATAISQLRSFLASFEKNIALVMRSAKLGLSTKDIATLLMIDGLFVKEFVEKIDTTTEKILQKELKRLQSKLSSTYSLELLKKDLIQLLLVFQFSEKAISKVLDCPLKLVKSVKSKNSK